MINTRKISVIGLGYVGLPVAVAFGAQQEVIAFDISESRVNALRRGEDITKETSPEALKSANLVLTTAPDDLKRADFHIVAVPTPIDDSNQPDLTPLIKVSEMLGTVVKSQDIIVFESTVYPGVTEEVCLPIIERISGLKGGADFFVGYSPERINPGDKEHTFTQIKKIVSGQTPEILQIISNVYASVITAGVYQASSIKVAEAAKVIENTQRDINIAFMNELALIFNKMGISIYEVLEAAQTKWNFLPFTPGLVGGHCIGVDPYYLTHKAQQLGFHPEMILSGRRTNDGMGKYIAEHLIKLMIKQNITIKHQKIGILGLTFKENCPDVRNTKVVDIVNELQSYHILPLVYDPVADHHAAYEEHQIELVSFEEIKHLDVVIVAVGHHEFKTTDFQNQLQHARIIFDIKNIFPKASNVIKL